MISVVIPVKNGGEPLARLLKLIASQEVDEEIEILVVDSGSTDGTQARARALGARVHEIAPSEFNHGETRNLGARLASGEIVAFTVDDAVPHGTRWLRDLTAPLRESHQLAGTYARQVAYPSAPPHQAFYIEHRYGPKPRIQRAGKADELSVSNVLFSNVSSAIKSSVLEEIPFASDIVIAEDLEWCTRVLLAGYAVAYVPRSVVTHSHDYSLVDTVKRYFDQGAAANRSFLSQERSTGSSVRAEGLRLVRRELGWLIRSGRIGAVPDALLHEAARFTGYQLGVHHRLVPRPLRGRLSRTAVYWSR